MVGSLIEIAVTDLAFDGKAVGHLDGKVVFLTGGLPGELVRARVTLEKRRYLQARVESILTPSPLRAPAPCAHFGTCGGCTWQDLTYTAQLEYKRKQVVDCLERLGKIESVEVLPAVPATRLFAYRNKMEFSFHTTGGDDFVLGLHARGAYDRIFDLGECHLQSDEANRVVSAVRDFVRLKRIPVYDVAHHSGYMRFLVIRQAAHTGELMVNLVTNRGPFPDADEIVRAIREAVPATSTIVHNETGAKANIAIGEVETILYGSGLIEETLFGKTFRIRPHSFFQTNSRQAETLYVLATDLLVPTADDHLLDLYCGTGTIGLTMADRVASVTGVELVPDAVVAANENARLNGITNATFHHGDVKEFLIHATREKSDAFSAVIVDPPRAGLHPKGVKLLVAHPVPKLLYISCNPATFARDASEFIAGGYTLSPVTPVDMFPHTMHIETVALLTYRGR